MVIVREFTQLLVYSSQIKTKCMLCYVIFFLSLKDAAGHLTYFFIIIIRLMGGVFSRGREGGRLSKLSKVPLPEMFLRLF